MKILPVKLATLAKVVVATTACLLLIELGIRIAYRIRNSRVELVLLPHMVRNFGSPPPWADGLRILDPDDELMWRGRPHAQQKYLDLFCPMHTEEERKAMLRRFSPSVPEELKHNPTWRVSLNADGFRDDEFPTKKTPGTIRIVALGDSWTFGNGADQELTYPRRLMALLRENFPGKKIDVLNLGMVAYSSHEGLMLLRQRIASVEPDTVLIGFGMNDSAISGWHDKDIFVTRPKRFNLKRFILENSEIYKLAAYLAQVRKFESITLGETLRAVADPNEKFLYESWVSADALEAKDYDRLEPRVRVPPGDYESNVRAMIKLVREHSATPILLHNDLRPGSPYQARLQKISREESVPLVDSCELLSRAKRDIEAELQRRLGLQPAEKFSGSAITDGIEVIFRVYVDDRPVTKAMYISGPHQQLGDCVPNKVAMYDDGTHGDQKPGDRVWSLTATFSPGEKVFYVYTNSGEDGVWENLDLPKVRSFVVPSDGGAKYRRIDTFGKLYLQADGFHTNAQGYDIMARAIRDAIVQTDKFKALAR
jgi:lysophospholipase L1-like esterase